jgi:hypothetical protein
METLLTDNWPHLILNIGLAGLALCAVLLLYYAITATLQSGSTAKYAYVAKHELGYFKVASVIIAIAVGLLVFSFLGNQFFGKGGYLLFFAGLVSISIAFMIGYALEQYFKVYYPFFLEKKLRNIRFHPRKSPDGRPMKLLREHEEDVHMTKEMIAEEDAFTFDYDVWLDDETGYKKIEKYEGHLHAIVCPRCEFRTLKDYKEVVMVDPTEKQNGRLRKYYRCSYCSHEEIKDVDIASKSEENEMVHDAELA